MTLPPVDVTLSALRSELRLAQARLARARAKHAEIIEDDGHEWDIGFEAALVAAYEGEAERLERLLDTHLRNRLCSCGEPADHGQHAAICLSCAIKLSLGEEAAE